MSTWSFLIVAAVAVAGTVLVAQLTGRVAAQERPMDDPMVHSSKTYTRPSEDEIRKKLTDLQFRVTQQDGTERPFANEFWDNKEPGIYVDVVSGEPLFSSTHKFKSGTGWPSFYKPLLSANVLEKRDTSHFMVRTEVRSKFGDSHLGHLFNDGPSPTGLRYCINSASLLFIPADELVQKGYGEFTVLFEDR